MDYNCNRCGTAVAEGTPFCPQCGAPQIRVNVGSPDPATPPFPPGTPAEMQPPAEPVWPPYAGSPDATVIHWGEALPLAVTSGVVAAVLSSLPILGILFIVWAAAAGSWTTSKYHKTIPLTVMTGSVGARLGALAGLVGGVLYGGIFVAFILLRPGFRSGFIEEMERRAGSQPEAQEVLRLMTSPEGFATLITGMMVLLVVIFVISGAIGGALAARSQKGPR